MAYSTNKESPGFLRHAIGHKFLLLLALRGHPL